MRWRLPYREQLITVLISAVKPVNAIAHGRYRKWQQRMIQTFSVVVAFTLIIPKPAGHCLLVLGVVTFVTLRVVQVDETRLQQCTLEPVAHLAPSPRTLRPILSSFARHAPEQNGAVPSQRQV
jgi:hypothetical protein